MAQLDINAQEAATLKEVLDFYLSELRMEIADTDRMDFREQLKAKKNLLVDVAVRVGKVSEETQTQ